MMGSVSIEDQVFDMSDLDFDEKETMKQSMEVVRNRRTRAIIMSTAIGVTEFRSQSKGRDPHQIVKGSISQTLRTIKCAREQNKRGLHFALETIIGYEDERREVIQELMNQEGMLVSEKILSHVPCRRIWMGSCQSNGDNQQCGKKGQYQHEDCWKALDEDN